MQKTLSLLLTLFSFSMQAQVPSEGFSFSILPGYLIAHHQELKQMEAHTMGFQLEYGINKNSQIFPFIQNYGLIYIDMGKPKMNGKIIGLTVNTESFINKKTRFKIGTGVGYLTKRFDVYKNPLNKAVSTHLNGCIQFGVLRKLYESKRSVYALGFGFTHFSNGSIKRPNYGVNFANAMLSYKFKNNRPDSLIKCSRFTHAFSKKFDIHIAYGKKEISVSDTKKFHIINASANYILNWKKKNYSQYITGLSLMLDPSNTYKHYQADDTPKPTFGQKAEISATFGKEWRLGKIDLVADIGVYIYRPNFIKMPVYQRVGFKYNLNQETYVLGRLKTHISTADHFEFGMGYRLKNDKIIKSPKW